MKNIVIIVSLIITFGFGWFVSTVYSEMRVNKFLNQTEEAVQQSERIIVQTEQYAELLKQCKQELDISLQKEK